MKICITGGAGFIGSNIAEQYLKLGHEVVIIDNLALGFRKNIPEGAKFYHLDITDNSIEDVFEKRKYISGVHGAPCTKFLKKQARYEFEIENKIDWHVLGFTVDELTRHERFTKFERENVLPILIDENLTKIDCFKIIEEAGIELPKIYKLGYPNANCIGCVKSQSPTYWNLVRETFPDVFEQRSEQSRRIGCKLVKLKGKRVFLDELPIDAKGGKIKSYECGIFCDTK